LDIFNFIYTSKKDRLLNDAKEWEDVNKAELCGGKWGRRKQVQMEHPFQSLSNFYSKSEG
jgi:hypothetical protein